jgi:DHA1 family bicyclomycin/chloramphenicol resistance-like MFS transporter
VPTFPAVRGRIAPGGRQFLAVVALCMAMAAMSIDLLLPAFPDMRRAFGLREDATEISTVVTAFLFGLAVGQLVYGPLSDRFGRKRLLYVGLAIYVAGAVASTAAESLGTFAVGRFLWGFGAASPRSLALAMIRDTYEGDQMARAMSHVMAVFILVPVFAPTVGAGLVEVGDWRLVVWVPVLAAIALAVLAVRLPETLPAERRRSVSPGALGEAALVVARNRQTVAFSLAATSLFGVVTSYIGSTEVIVDEVFGQPGLFPVLFGVLAIGLALGSLLSGRLVMRLGLDRLVRYGGVYVVGAAAVLAGVAIVTDGHPPLWLFMVATGLTLPGVTTLVPNCNTAAMRPLAHVAGMAAAVIGTFSTAVGALLGSVVDRSYDGSVMPFSVGAFVFSAVACACIWAAPRPAPAVDLDAVAQGEAVPALVD